MKSKVFFSAVSFSIVIFLTGPACAKRKTEINDLQLREGDLIFQTSTSSQSRALEEATHSQWTHVGILFREEGEWVVAEASRVVMFTPLAQFIARGEGERFSVKRIRPTIYNLGNSELTKIKKALRSFMKLPYDVYFQWSNNRIYCSELIWKVLNKGINYSPGKLEQFKDLDLKSAAVKKLILERYGDIKQVNLNETIITPISIYSSEDLELVGTN